ncbi:MAG: hypothetical protein ACO239_00550, partial [Sediminibacterium sp.]
MSITVKLRRGNTSSHSTFTGAVGEVTVDTDKNSLVVHDGTTAGGVPLAREDYVQSAFDTANNAGSNATVVASYEHANSA